jgi:hypothetical protein
MIPVPCKVRSKAEKLLFSASGGRAQWCQRTQQQRLVDLNCTRTLLVRLTDRRKGVYL